MQPEELREQVKRGDIDTVLLVICDMQGRLQGKRLTARHFLDEVLEHGAEGCNYLLAVDVDAIGDLSKCCSGNRGQVELPISDCSLQHIA